MTTSPDNKPVLLITGASRGIGAATAILAAEAGYAVAVNYLNDHHAAEAVVKAIQDHQGVAIACQADVSQETQVNNLFKQIDAELGTITALVNNVGVLATQMRCDELNEQRINHILTTNVTSTLLVSGAAIKRMSTRYGGNGGAIVNVSSVAARLGSPNEYVDYAASKGAIDTLTIGIAREVVNEKIRVNAVRPGLIETDIHQSGGEPNRVHNRAPSLPMRRGGQPDEVANAILFLLSDQASYITGSLIDVAGGL